ncbi:DUF6279 family lipoprotein [Nitrospira sp. BLG_2]|uniref:DUF6279 family lipoprotein n=1 Tax=Nitrospira sp. BLG_2 TaxID=3397507 RepID=UPI003B9B6C4A
MTSGLTIGGRKRRGRLYRWSWCLAVIVVALAGCSLTTTAYRYADRIVLWKLDHYFSLNRDQRQDVAQRLTPLLEKHRHEALPQYETFLQEIRQRVERGLTGSDIDWAYTTYDRLRADLFERLVADTGVFLASVDTKQVRVFESTLQKDTIQAARVVQISTPERLNKRVEATLDLVKDWLGPLTKGQKSQIREWSLALPDVEPMWVAYQQQRRQELVTLLHQPRTPERIARELRAMFVYHDQTAPQAYQSAVSQMRENAKAMALAIDRGVTPEQRRHAVSKLQRLIDQVHDLQAG